MKRSMIVALSATLLLGWTDNREPTLHRSTYTNPVLNRNFPDPTVIRANGRYYAYATQSGSRHFQVSHSRDLVNWSRPHEALPRKAGWATNDVFWAPHVIERKGIFYLYYSAAPKKSDIEGAICLAVATSERPQGPFKDVGKPLYCGDTGSDIDAAVFRDPASGKWYAYWGSGGDIAVARMARNLVSLRKGAFPKTIVRGWSAKVRRPYEHGIEGPWLVHRKGWYYVFYSGNKCCEYPPHYAPMVARSRRPMGKFKRYRTVKDRPRHVLLHSNRRWAGPGHNSVIADALGHQWFVYHAIDRRDPYLPDGGVRRVMLINRLHFEGGWPAVGSGTPSIGRRRGPVTRY